MHNTTRRVHGWALREAKGNAQPATDVLGWMGQISGWMKEKCEQMKHVCAYMFAPRLCMFSEKVGQ